MTITIDQALKWHATYNPRRLAVQDDHKKESYAELWQRSVQLVLAMKAAGVKKNDKISVLLPNCAQFIEIYHAAALCGIAVVPINFRLAPREAQYIIEHSESKLLFYYSDFSDLVKEINIKDTPVAFIQIGPGREDDDEYNDFIGKYDEKGFDGDSDGDRYDAPFYQGYTSGTTGTPKGCVNPLGPFSEQLTRIIGTYRFESSDRQLMPAPLFHEAPALFSLAQIFAGGSLLLTKDPAPENIAEIINKQSPTNIFMVPTMWETLTISPEVDRVKSKTLRLLVSGGSALLTHTRDKLFKAFPDADVNEFYGGTEVGLVSNITKDEMLRKYRSVGRPVFGKYIKIIGEDGEEVTPGEVGEIYMAGQLMLREYYKNPEATAKARLGEWLTLGDLGSIDKDGYLYIVDRKKDMIISGGENIFPAEIENVISKMPEVFMCAVVGQPDPRWGEVVTAYVVPTSGAHISKEEVQRFCAQELANFKIPKEVYFKRELPMSAFGKILRRELRQ